MKSQQQHPTYKLVFTLISGSTRQFHSICKHICQLISTNQYQNTVRKPQVTQRLSTQQQQQHPTQQLNRNIVNPTMPIKDATTSTTTSTITTLTNLTPQKRNSNMLLLANSAIVQQPSTTITTATTTTPSPSSSSSSSCTTSSTSSSSSSSAVQPLQLPLIHQTSQHQGVPNVLEMSSNQNNIQTAYNTPLSQNKQRRSSNTSVNSSPYIINQSPHQAFVAQQKQSNGK
jgi:hypothetical protein